MTAETAAELTNRIENKLVEVHKLRRDLRELNQQLRVEVERLEGTEELARHGRSIRWEELEWEIICTESAIKGTIRELNELQRQLLEVNSAGLPTKIASE